ncbi:hypothetical protein CHELA41_22871 [Hyphomicrobiales bacterium]|nr:hypothetical protein CHELA41_22871 [Hyphomicrobiales bacterium]
MPDGQNAHRRVVTQKTVQPTGWAELMIHASGERIVVVPAFRSWHGQWPVTFFIIRSRRSVSRFADPGSAKIVPATTFAGGEHFAAHHLRGLSPRAGFWRQTVAVSRKDRTCHLGRMIGLTLGRMAAQEALSAHRMGKVAIWPGNIITPLLLFWRSSVLTGSRVSTNVQPIQDRDDGRMRAKLIVSGAPSTERD